MELISSVWNMITNIIFAGIEIIITFAPQFALVLAAYIAVIGTRKQSAREYIAKERSDWLVMTRNEYVNYTINLNKWNTFITNGFEAHQEIDMKNNLDEISKNFNTLRLLFNPIKDIKI